MDLQWLITFKEIVETGSYTKAADNLGYTQSSITLQIKQLEQELSTKLFEKIGRNMCLTSAGRAIIPQVDQIIMLISQMKQENHSSSCGRLNIDIEETLLINRLQNSMPRFFAEMPNIYLRLDTGKSCTQVRDELRRGAVDIGMLYKAPDDLSSSPMLIETVVATVPMVMVGGIHADLPWNDEIGIPTADHMMYLNDENCIFHIMYEKYLQTKGVQLKHMITLGSTEANLDFIERGCGIAYLPKYIVENRLKAGTLRELRMDTSQNYAYIAYAVHKNKWISPAMALFIQLFKESLEGIGGTVR